MWGWMRVRDELEEKEKLVIVICLCDWFVYTLKNIKQIEFDRSKQITTRTTHHGGLQIRQLSGRMKADQFDLFRFESCTKRADQMINITIQASFQIFVNNADCLKTTRVCRTTRILCIWQSMSFPSQPVRSAQLLYNDRFVWRLLTSSVPDFGGRSIRFGDYGRDKLVDQCVPRSN